MSEPHLTATIFSLNATYRYLQVDRRRVEGTTSDETVSYRSITRAAHVRTRTPSHFVSGSATLQHEVPLALLMFNVGVETGQVAFLCAAAIVITGLRRATKHVPIPGILRVAPYAIGSVATFWTIQRIVSMT